MTGPLDLALQLIGAGIPVLVVKGGKKFPRDWESATADPTAVTGFTPGVDALVMVSGWGIDVVDEDSKAGGSVDALPQFKNYGVVRTPSGGRHFYVPSSGIGTRRLPAVGDYQGGRGDGSSRGLVFLPGSVRDKYPDGGYDVISSIQVAECITGAPNPDLERALGEDAGVLETYIDDSPERTEPGLHPYASAVVARELGRLRALQDDGWEGEPWDSTTYQVACNLIEIANSNWSGYTLADAEADLHECAPVDEKFDFRNHAEKWSSALGKVGNGGRRNPDSAHAVWDASPRLAHVRQAAHARMVGSGALLCYVLGRVLAETRPHVMLPPTIGAAAPLNLAFAIVGDSGTGKSAGAAVSAELLDLGQDPIETGVGSGEGLIEAFLEADPDNPGGKRLVSPPARILNIDEIARLGSVARRDGSSMMDILRTSLTGGSLKTANATQDRKRSVPAGQYRLVVFAGVQPQLSDVLLGEVDAGTPQRFCWVSSTDRTLPDELPEWPGVLDWSPVIVENMPPTLIDYPDHIKEEIRRNHARKMRGEEGVDPRQGHRSMTQLKLAAALALFHDQTYISDLWWGVAAHMMRWSEKEQLRCKAALKGAAEARVVAQARGAVVQRQVLEADLVKRVESRMLAGLKSGKTWPAVKQSLSAPQREVMQEALDSLEKAGLVTVTHDEYRGQPRMTVKVETK